jgi:tRNA A37 threonylcarbamoyladenosine dehydratase
MFGECGLGSWTAEALKKAGQTEIGIVNGGSFG